MLRVVYLTTLISAIHLLKYCVYFCYRKNCNHPFFEVNVSFLLVVPLFVTRCQSLSFVVTRCATCCPSLSFIVICCHSLSFVVTQCTSRLSFYKRMSTIDPAFAYLTYLFFFYLLAGTVKVHVKYQSRKLLQQQKAVNQDLFYPLPVPISKNCLFEKT